jgi:crotonobetainyl-CoA:carnitine CoA-transferase CaiB-like acyl-CoA transferase
LIAALDTEFAARTRDEWVARFDAHDVWFAPVLTPDEVVADAQAIAAGAFVDVDGNDAPDGAPAHRSVATPVEFGAAAVGPRGPVPALGEHTAEVLEELGYPESALASLAPGAGSGGRRLPPEPAG